MSSEETTGMLEASLGVRHTGCPMSDTSSRFPNVSIQNVAGVDSPGEYGRRLIYLRGDSDDIDGFTAACRNHERVSEFRQASERSDTEVYFTFTMRNRDTNPSILNILTSKGVFNHGATSVRDGIEHWLVYSEERATVAELIEEIESHDNEVTLFGIVNLRETTDMTNVEAGIPLSQLTDRQRTTFQVALDLDYYESDGDTTVSDIAAELGLHETTAWEHLNKAENAILTEVGRRYFPDR